MSHHLPIVPILFIVVFVVGPMLFRALFGSKKRVVATTIETNENQRRSNFAEVQRVARQFQEGGGEAEELAELLSLAKGGNVQSLVRTLRDAASVTITTTTETFTTTTVSDPSSYARPTHTATVSTSHNASALADILRRQAEKAAAAALTQIQPRSAERTSKARPRARTAQFGTLVDPVAMIDPMEPLPRLNPRKARAPLAPRQPSAPIAISL